MKKILFILSLLFVSSAPLLAQDDDPDDGNDKIRDKMNEFIQKRLDLSKAEAEKFSPVFIRYFQEWRQTLREGRQQNLPALDRQQRIVDLQLRYRTQFRDIVGERRGNQVFDMQRLFIREMQNIRKERLGNTPPVRRRGP